MSGDLPRRCRRLEYLALFALAGTSLGADAPPPADACLDRPSVVVYLHDVQDRVMDTWLLPEDLVANREVVVRLEFSGDGTLVRYRLASFTSHRLAQSVERALQQVGPFADVPPEARCLLGRTIVTTFRNPA